MMKRKINSTKQFKKDYKRELKGQHGASLDAVLRDVLKSLEIDETLAAKHKDHLLTGNWKPKKDCHLKPDLVLIYEKEDDATLTLVRLGSHSELSI